MMHDDDIGYIVIRVDAEGMQTLRNRMANLGRSIGLRVDYGAKETLKELVSERERELAAEVADLRRRLSMYELPIGGTVHE